MKRSKSAFFQEKNSVTEFLKDIARALAIGALLVLAVIVIIYNRPSYAADTDWHDNALSEQIQQEARCEQKGGVFENGVCLPPNLTLAAERELQAYTAQRQAEINRTLGEK